MTLEINRGSKPALPEIYRPLNKKENFLISLFNRDSQGGAVNLRLVLFTENSVSLKDLGVCMGASNNYHCN